MSILTAPPGVSFRFSAYIERNYVLLRCRMIPHDQRFKAKGCGSFYFKAWEKREMEAFAYFAEALLELSRNAEGIIFEGDLDLLFARITTAHLERDATHESLPPDTGWKSKRITPEKEAKEIRKDLQHRLKTLELKEGGLLDGAEPSREPRDPPAGLRSAEARGKKLRSVVQRLSDRGPEGEEDENRSPR